MIRTYSRVHYKYIIIAILLNNIAILYNNNHDNTI